MTCRNSFSLVLLCGFFAVSSSSVSSPPLVFPWVSSACVWPVVHRLFLIVSLCLFARLSLFVGQSSCVSWHAVLRSCLCQCPIFCLPDGLAEFSDSVFSRPFAWPRRQETHVFSDACFHHTSLHANTSKVFLTPGGQERRDWNHLPCA